MIDFICRDVMEEIPEYPENSFDGCFCDPPYGLGFMGNTWDHGVPSADVWREVHRVLKPGAMLLAFGGTRTWHRLTCAIEDAGFEIRDTLMWLYGSGFPKSLDISKAIDKTVGAEREVISVKRAGIGRNSRGGAEFVNYTPIELEKTVPVTAPATPEASRWSGYGTALKPAWEPIILAMKPCDGTFAENALKHGVVGLAIDAGRIPTQAPAMPKANQNIKGNAYKSDNRGWEKDTFYTPDQQGRWPANLLLDEEAAGMLDEQSGVLTSGKMKAGTKRRNRAGWAGPMPEETGLDTIGDSGGASRFFYCAKASRRERGEGNHHPTVKPLSLCQYLASLILPPERDTPRWLLVPFSGSGSEAIAAEQSGWDLVTAIESDESYVTIAKSRHENKEISR